MEFSLSDRVKKIRESLKMSQLEFSQLFDLSQRTISNWESGRNEPPFIFFQTMVKNYSVNPNWLLVGNGEIFDHLQNIEIPQKTKILFLESFRISNESNELDEYLKDFLLSKSLKKLDCITRSNKFWDKLLLNRLESLNFKRILTRALSDSKKSFHNEILSPNSAKQLLLKIIQDYEIRLYKDTIHNAITEKTKNKLIDWLEDEFDDISCFIILSDFDNSINAIKSTLNTIDQLTINLN